MRFEVVHTFRESRRASDRITNPEEKVVVVTLSRRNLQALLNKLDRNAENPGASFVELQTYVPEARLTLAVKGEENDDHYGNRPIPAGHVVEEDDPGL